MTRRPVAIEAFGEFMQGGPTLRRFTIRLDEFQARPSHGYNLGDMQGMYEGFVYFAVFLNAPPTSIERLVETFHDMLNVPPASS